jgi:hypothetical protein
MGGPHQVAGIMRLADILDPDPEITAHFGLDYSFLTVSNKATNSELRAKSHSLRQSKAS